MKKQLISKIIWLVLAIALWVTGLILFTNNPDKLAGYLIWGALCTICTIKQVMSTAKKGAKDGRRKGANEYSITDNGSHYTVQNHPLRGAIIGFIAGILAGVLMGPILVPIYSITNVLLIIKIAKQMRKA